MNAPALLIHLAGLLVPAARRAEWTKEWLAELHYAQAHAGQARSFAFARGAFRDAVWQQRDFWTPKRIARATQAPWFCLGVLGSLVMMVVMASGMLPRTRNAALPMAYRNASKIFTIAQSGTMATRAGVLGSAVELWRASTKTLDGIATYSWESKEVAGVSENFFFVLGARTSTGRSFDRDAFRDCAPKSASQGAPECVVLSYDFWRSLEGAEVTIDGKPCRVAAVTAPGFWFLSPKISAWRMDAINPKARTGVVARLAAGTTQKEAEMELGEILRSAGANDWDTLFELTSVRSRVRFVFGLFAFCVGIATLIVLPTLHLRMPKWNPCAAAFFAAKIALGLLAVLLCGIEFTGASAITVLGGSDGLMAISTWLFVMASMGVLAWAIADQRQRCRVCQKRLGMAQHVGCPGCMLLDWAGTELVCLEGHGMLHVPEMAASWQDPDRWTLLDETWQGLFERS